MKLSKIVVTSNAPMHKVTWEDLAPLRTAAPDAEVILVDNAEELVQKASDADALFTMPIRGSEVFDRYCEEGKSLKWLQLMTAGFDFLLNTPLEHKPGLTVTSTNGIHGEPISNHVLALMFSHLRKLQQSFAQQQKHQWKGSTVGYDEIGKKTVGIIGPGAIGLCVAKKCKALGMKVYGANPFPMESELLDHCWLTPQLEEMLAVSDFVVISAPLTDETRKMMNAERFAQMKQGSYLINIARGGIVDLDALKDAVESGHLAGAGLDVTDPEPLPEDHPLWDVPGVTITGHVAAQSPYYFERALENYCENVRRYLADEPLRNVCKRPDGSLFR